MTRQELTAYMESILPADRDAMDAARRRQAELAKPPGSLGALEDMSIRLAGVLRTARPEVRRCRVTVLAADNGVVAEGVSCAPQSVTVQQAVNMTRHKTGMSALAAYFGDDVQVVDVGIRTPVPCPQVLDRKVRFSTGDIAVEPAMTEQQLAYNLPFEFHDFLTEEKSKYFFDYSVREVRRDPDGYPLEMDLFACAMLKERVEAYRAMFRRAGFRQRVLTPDESAYSALLEEHIAHHGGEDTDRCIVSLGHRSTYLYIFHGSRFDSRRGVEVGGAELDSLIADHCGVDVHVAHSYKHSDYNGVLESDYAQELYARLAGEIVRAVNFYNYNNRDRELKGLYLCGGGAGIAALRETIAETTRLEVHPATDLLPEQQRPEEEPWLYLRAIAGVFESFRGGKR